MKLKRTIKIEALEKLLRQKAGEHKEKEEICKANGNMQEETMHFWCAHALSTLEYYLSGITDFEIETEETL